jgi:hypothetical protein
MVAVVVVVDYQYRRSSPTAIMSFATQTLYEKFSSSSKEIHESSIASNGVVHNEPLAMHNECCNKQGQGQFIKGWNIRAVRDVGKAEGVKGRPGAVACHAGSAVCDSDTRPSRDTLRIHLGKVYHYGLRKRMTE